MNIIHEIGDVAHMVERSLSMREVLGSMPNFSTLSFSFVVFLFCAIGCVRLVINHVFLRVLLCGDNLKGRFYVFLFYRTKFFI